MELVLETLPHLALCSVWIISFNWMNKLFTTLKYVG